MITPDWALLLSFWIHMLATAAWLGGLAAVALFVLPAMRARLGRTEFADWVSNLNQQLNTVGWLSIGLLTFTGLTQMGDNPNYAGLFQFGNDWAMAIFLKHIAFFGMVGMCAYSTWKLAPELQRSALRRAKGSESGNEAALQRRFQLVTTANLVLGGIVLAFTALARIA